MIADLDGRVAVVTGAASGIGRVAATVVAANGMRVVLADINGERLAHAMEEIRKAGGEALGVHCDVTSDEDVAAFHTAERESFDPVDLGRRAFRRSRAACGAASRACFSSRLWNSTY